MAATQNQTGTPIILGPNGQPIPSSGGSTPPPATAHPLEEGFAKVDEKVNSAYEKLAQAEGANFEKGIADIERSTRRANFNATSEYFRNTFSKDFVKFRADALKAGDTKAAKKSFFDYLSDSGKLDDELQKMPEEAKKRAEEFFDQVANSQSAIQDNLSRIEQRKAVYSQSLENIKDYSSYSSKEREAIAKLQYPSGIISQYRNESGVRGRIARLLTSNPEKQLEKIQQRHVSDIEVKENILKERLRDVNNLDVSAAEKGATTVGSRAAAMRGGGGAKGIKGALKGAGGKAAAVVGLLGLGAVIGNMFSGGHRSNAELYNPNGYSQYYS